MKKVLALMGSPRRHRNTEDLLDYLLDGVNKSDYEIEKLILKDLDVHYCTGCNHCGRTSECIYKDDMQMVYENIDNSDIIIFAAPIYFNSINSLSKDLVDRCQKYWSIKYVLGQAYKRNENRRGIFLSVGGAPFSHSQFYGSVPVMDFFFKAINVDYVGNYFISNTDEVQVNERRDIEKELNSIGNKIDDIGSFQIHK
ncbi:MAG: flavodoxin family protein [Tissierellia bacterium]|nr:flavodoxin family protein [Tissierellia bacterium]